MDLLARNGAVVRSGKADLPTALWNAIPDGVGTLWICGDLRRLYGVPAHAPPSRACRHQARA
ncbi:hypothetical protein ABTY61_22975 [Kitasatospora sp. NPDC096128]|uniref:hypothetical protein n=1 Tax=Kitasatospora sp. NPDC096128 TaxID=3155547 RepID=UPI00331B3DD2